MCFLVVTIASACQSLETTLETPEIATGDCLPTLFEFSFPYRDEGITEVTHSMPSIAGIMLQVDENDKPIMAYEGNLVVRGDDEIWLSRPFTRYNPRTKEIKEYTDTILDSYGEPVHPVALFLGSDNLLIVTATNSTHESILFARYDDQNDQFEIISPENDIFMRLSGGGVRNIVEDQDGKLWFVNQKNLIRFDPKTSQAEKVLGEEQGYIPWDAFVVSLNNTLFLAAEKLYVTGDGEVERLDLEVIKYDIQTGDIQQYGAPPLTDANAELFIDHKERLWFNDFGYLEFIDNGSWTWYQIIRSPIFISDRSGNYRYTWARPAPKVETHGRYLWFTFSGLARLDLETYDWCLVSETAVNNIAKDSQDNLWFISDRQLYKYEFESIE